MLLREFFNAYYRPRRLPGAAINTLRLYAITFAHFDRFLKRPAELSDLSGDTVAQFLEYMAIGRAARTSNKCRDQLLAVSRYARDRGCLTEIPDVLPRPEPRRIPNGYTFDQVCRLLCACRQRRGTVCGLPAGGYWSAVCAVFYSTAMRAGAVWQIRRADLDLDHAKLFVPAEHQKHRCDQVFRLTPQTVEMVRAIWLPERDLLFPWPSAASGRYHHWHEIQLAADLPIEIWRSGFHKLRRAVAQLATEYGAKAGFSATEQLGHSSDAVTRRHYLPQQIGPQAADVLPDLPIS